MENNYGYVFISYSSQNQQVADSFRQFLIEEGIACWMAPYDIPAGSKYGQIINDALENCSGLLLILSEASQKSQFVSRELERAVAYNKPIFPVQIEMLMLNSEFKFFIGGSQIVGISDVSRKSAERDRLISVLDALLGKKAESDKCNEVINEPVYDGIYEAPCDKQYGDDAYYYLRFSKDGRVRGLGLSNGKMYAQHIEQLFGQMSEPGDIGKYICANGILIFSFAHVAQDGEAVAVNHRIEVRDNGDTLNEWIYFDSGDRIEQRTYRLLK